MHHSFIISLLYVLSLYYLNILYIHFKEKICDLYVLTDVPRIATSAHKDTFTVIVFERGRINVSSKASDFYLDLNIKIVLTNLNMVK